MKKLISLSLVASSLLFADSDLEQLKIQVNQQQQMINELLKKIETKDATLEESLLQTTKKMDVIESKVVQNTQTSVAPKDKKSRGSKNYMPDISLVTDFSYVSRSKSDDDIKHLEIPGVAHGFLGSHEHDGHAETRMNGKEGFNFNYAELAMSSEVDPYLNLTAYFHLTEDDFEIEEAFATSNVLGHGIQLKVGKFRSDFGYHNNKHHHVWSFSDAPLVYESFLGMHGINEIGAQFQWVAPTSNYLMFGAEVLQGDNEQMFGTDSIYGSDEETPLANGSDAPALFVAYVKTSFDIGETTILGGVSYAQGSSRLDHTTDEEAHAFSGDSKVYGVDLLVKKYFDSYSYLSWQSELLIRDMDGEQYALDSNKNVTGTIDLQKEQSGYYTQLEYAHNNNWKTALRYDSIYANDVIKNGVNSNQQDSLDKYSAMLEYKTSEFAKFRLQYNRNNALYNEDGKRQHIDTVILQANFAIGAHGAHSF